MRNLSVGSALLGLSLLAPVNGAAALISGSGPGGAIFDNATVTSDIIFVSPLIITGNLTVTINGLTHTWIGDLTATLTHVDTGTEQSIFWRVRRVGVGSGDSSDFDGNYSFNNSFPGDLWAVALATGDSESIPPGLYFPTGADSGAAINLSNFFNGESAAGTWRLTIEDLAGGDTGSFSGWDLSMQVVPEPSSAVPLALGILAMGCQLWRKKRAR